jgi:hypothetical protein
MSGRGGTGGTTGARSGLDLSCLRDLLAPCVCGLGADAAAGTACYPSGVTSSSTQQGSCEIGDGGPSASVVTTTTVRRANGEICYTVERSCQCGQACEILTSVWRNGPGQIVARGVSGFAPTSITCEATGESCRGTGGIGGLDQSCAIAIGNCTTSSCP